MRAGSTAVEIKSPSAWRNHTEREHGKIHTPNLGITTQRLARRKQERKTESAEAPRQKEEHTDEKNSTEWVADDVHAREEFWVTGRDEGFGK